MGQWLLIGHERRDDVIGSTELSEIEFDARASNFSRFQENEIVLE